MKPYVDPIVARLKYLLKTEGPPEIKKVIYGPVAYEPHKALLPLISISRRNATDREQDTGSDQLIMPFVMSLISSWQVGLGDGSWITAGYNSLDRYCINLNDDCELQPKCLLYVLRKNKRLWHDKNVIMALNPNPGNIFTNGLVERAPAGGNTVSTFSVEATIEFNITVKDS